MRSDRAERQSSQDLAAMAAAASGSVRLQATNPLDEELRAAKVEELKAQYKAGVLAVDANALAAKMVDSSLADSSPRRSTRVEEME